MTKQRIRKHLIVIWLMAALTLVLFLLAYPGQEKTATAASHTQPFYELMLDLQPGQIIHPTYTQMAADQQANFSLTVSGSAPVTLEITGSGGDVSWSGTVKGTETLWGITTLTTGSNQFALQNNGDTAAAITFKLFSTPEIPYQWTGNSQPGGHNSAARMAFPQSGLYTFDFGVNEGGRYAFLLGDNYIRKSVSGPTSVTYYVEAGIHNLSIAQDSGSGPVAWQVSIAYSGTTSDALPYQKNGTQISEEWLPIFIDSAAPVNLVITTTGKISNTLSIKAFNGSGDLINGSNRTVHGGETLWSTFNLASGINLIHLVANQEVIDYTLVIHGLPSAPYRFSGKGVEAGGENRMRVVFPTSGLYTFDFSKDSGRFQFRMDEKFIQKTVESNTSVSYYVAAGARNLYIQPDSHTGAAWSVGISSVGAASDTLPYAKSGGDIGGDDNFFHEEWLPVMLTTARQVNLSLRTTGSRTDRMRVDVYPDGSEGPSASYEILGTEKAWSSFELGAGVNRLRLVSTGNSAPMTYHLALSTMPEEGQTAWDGVSLDQGHQSTITVQFPGDGVYSFALESQQGFANLLLDDVPLEAISAVGRRTGAIGSTRADEGWSKTVYERAVTAGDHQVTIVQDPAFSTTAWKATIKPVIGKEDTTFLTLEGRLEAGTIITQVYGALAEPVDFNFSITAKGGAADLDLLNAEGSLIWDKTILDGETIWGTAAFTGISQIQIREAAGKTTHVALTFNYLSGVEETWRGKTTPTGAKSHIRMAFPASGLYMFDLGLGGSGRYQFLLNDKFIQKTVEGDTSVHYYVPAGVHDLMVRPDSQRGADWSVAVSSVGEEANHLPYARAGGEIGGVGNEFSEEWLPIQLAEAVQANVVVTASGSMSDSLSLQVWDQANNTMTAAPIFGTESLWATTHLPKNARLRLLANAANNNTLRYEIAIHPIPKIPYQWTGRSLAAGIHPAIQLIAPINGTYRVAVSLFEGFINFGQITPVPQTDQRLAAANIAFNLPLKAGVYSFMGQQSRQTPVNRWLVEVSLLAADALEVATVTPNVVKVGQNEQLLISGLNFIEPTVHLVAEDEKFPLDLESVTSTEITLVLPHTLPVGVYDLVITDSDERQVRMIEVLTVEARVYYMPSIHK
jgi:hypothetical protein